MHQLIAPDGDPKRMSQWEQSADRKPLVQDFPPAGSLKTTMLRCRGDLWRLSPILVWGFLSALVPSAVPHPQCLDFKPPFRPMRELQFCVMYKQFGCCDHQRDQELMSQYYRIMDRFDSEGFETCAGYVLDLLCQVGMRTKVAGSRTNTMTRWEQLSLWDQLWTDSKSALECPVGVEVTMIHFTLLNKVLIALSQWSITGQSFLFNRKLPWNCGNNSHN